MFDYSPFEHTLIERKKSERGLNKYRLREEGVISTTSLVRMSKGLPVSLSVVGRLCERLNCDIPDIVKYVPNKQAPE